METLSYWLARLEPVIRAETEGEIIVVLANRCGTEGEAVYAGTSAVLGIQSGEVNVYGILGRGEKELLIVNTKLRPQAKLVSDPRSIVSNSKRDSIVSNPRSNSTNSIVSEESTTSYSSLSVNTQSTERTSANPPTPPAPPAPGGMEMTIGDIATPVSPIASDSPSQFFGSRAQIPDLDPRRESLKSSIGQQQVAEVAAAKPDSPTFVRPETPKSRNRCRTGHPDHEDSTLISNGDTEKSKGPIFGRPPSPKSRNCSRTRQPEYQDIALISHDLAKEPQITSRSIGVKSSPHSASAVLDHYKQTSTDNGLGPRSRHISPRPSSMIW
jgi:hypothetical protein